METKLIELADALAETIVFRQELNKIWLWLVEVQPKDMSSDEFRRWDAAFSEVSEYEEEAIDAICSSANKYLAERG